MAEILINDHIADYDFLVVNAEKFGYSGRNNRHTNQDNGLIGDYVYATKKNENILHELRVNKDGKYTIDYENDIVVSIVDTGDDTKGKLISYIDKASSVDNALYASQEGVVLSRFLEKEATAEVELAAFKGAVSRYLYGKFNFGNKLFTITEEDIDKLVAGFHNGSGEKPKPVVGAGV